MEWKRPTLAPAGEKRKFVLVLESADWVRKYQIWGKSPFENLLIHSVYGGSCRCFGESSRGWKEQESPSAQVFLWQQSSIVARCLFWSDRLSPDTKFTAYSKKNFAKPPQLQKHGALGCLDQSGAPTGGQMSLDGLSAASWRVFRDCWAVPSCARRSDPDHAHGRFQSSLTPNSRPITEKSAEQKPVHAAACKPLIHVQSRPNTKAERTVRTSKSRTCDYR